MVSETALGCSIATRASALAPTFSSDKNLELLAARVATFGFRVRTSLDNSLMSFEAELSCRSMSQP
jgi:hypothetical protein